MEKRGDRALAVLAFVNFSTYCTLVSHFIRVGSIKVGGVIVSRFLYLNHRMR